MVRAGERRGTGLNATGLDIGPKGRVPAANSFTYGLARPLWDARERTSEREARACSLPFAVLDVLV
ncbi:MAG: hypothetical protein M3380_01905 [Chloroflexota bacterium]|nr:hypothetical protein [Chloroflexota bacterium]